MELATDGLPGVVREPEDTTTATEVVPEKKKRKRFKKISGQIRQQMEFYFSDANLRQDRFLKKQIDQSSDGAVELSLFANFNKLKVITSDMTLVAKALSSSKMLKVSEDKKRVWRVTPLVEAPDVDERTVYVECLPATSDHEYLRKVFSSCGSVSYVSLPRYRSSGDIKGFAFIEFESKGSAQKACELLNNPPASASSKPGKFPKGSKQLQSLARQVAAQKQEYGEDGNGETAKGKKRKRSRSGSDSAGEEKTETPRKGRKRKTSQSEGSGEETSATPTKRRVLQGDRISPKEERKKKHKDKKRKLSNEAESDSNIVKQAKLSITDSSGPVDEARTEDGESKDSSTSTPMKQESIMKRDGTSQGVDDVKASRKRKSDGGEAMEKKVRISEKVEVKVAEEVGKKRKKKKKKVLKLDLDLPELRVMPKSEWLELKKEYVSLQKASMRELKQALRKHRLPEEAGTTACETDMEVSSGNTEVKKDAKAAKMEFIPNVILKVSSDKEIFRKQLKEAVSSHGEIAYVDVLEGQLTGYVRCPDVENASRIVGATIQGYAFEELKGEEEKVYWEKLTADREKRLQTKSRSKRRGRDKVIKQAEKTNNNINKRKHIFF